VIPDGAIIRIQYGGIADTNSRTPNKIFTIQFSEDNTTLLNRTSSHQDSPNEYNLISHLPERAFSLVPPVMSTNAPVLKYDSAHIWQNINADQLGPMWQIPISNVFYSDDFLRNVPVEVPTTSNIKLDSTTLGENSPFADISTAMVWTTGGVEKYIYGARAQSQAAISTPNINNIHPNPATADLVAEITANGTRVNRVDGTNFSKNQVYVPWMVTRPEAYEEPQTFIQLGAFILDHNNGHNKTVEPPDNDTTVTLYMWKDESVRHFMTDATTPTQSQSEIKLEITMGDGTPENMTIKAYRNSTPGGALDWVEVDNLFLGGHDVS